MSARLQHLVVPSILLALAGVPRVAVAQGEHHHGTAAPADSGANHAKKHHKGHDRLSYDERTSTVTFKLIAGRRHAKSPLNFNGYGSGEATLVVPSNSSVVLKFENKDSLPHSAVLISDKDPMPERIEQPAIPHAATRDPAQGVPAKGTEEIRFKAPASGSYRIASGVPGQARSGMWIRFKVDPAAKQPEWSKGG